MPATRHVTTEPEAGRTAPSRRSPLFRLVINLVAAFVVMDVGLQIVLGVVQPDGGPIGLLGVVAQPVALVGLLAIPIAIASKTRRIWIALASLAVVAGPPDGKGAAWLDVRVLMPDEPCPPRVA